MPSLRRRRQDERACGRWLRGFHRLFTWAELGLRSAHAGERGCRAGSLQHPGTPQVTTAPVQHGVTPVAYLEHEFRSVRVSGCPSQAIDARPRARAPKLAKLLFLQHEASTLLTTQALHQLTD